MGRKFLGAELKSAPVPHRSNPNVVSVEAEGFKADVHKDALHAGSSGTRCALRIPDLSHIDWSKREQN
jgi:hypothetical protein